nr:SDR family oxidoreductase [uncultured Microbacterium sp.]
MAFRTGSRDVRVRGVRHRRRPLSQQVVVITGGSRGIGRATAERVAAAGATVVVLGRHEGRLRETVDHIVAAGGEARFVLCDVADAEEVRRAAETVVGWFGRIDTWVNNAGVLLYGRFEETTPEEFRRVTEVDYLGQIHGAQAALPALRRAGGGAIIAVSSVEARSTLPLHSAYAASKRAVEGAMQGLRRELIDQREPISVTIVRPTVTDTPGYASTRSHLDRRPSAPPPRYAPSVVAACIAFAAEHPIDEIHAGGGGRMLAAAQTLFPRTLDRVFGRWGVRMMHTREIVPPHPGNLYSPDGQGDRGQLPTRGRRFSLYTWLAVHPRARRLLIVTSALALAAHSAKASETVRSRA